MLILSMSNNFCYFRTQVFLLVNSVFIMNFHKLDVMQSNFVFMERLLKLLCVWLAGSSTWLSTA